MKINTRIQPKNQDIFVILQDETFLENQRYAGKIATQAIHLLEGLIKEKTKLTFLEMSKMAEDFIIENKCLPTFKGFHGFPEAVCISINKHLVHGIPQDILPQEGDVISFDLGATYKEAVADTATTIIYGHPKSNEHVRLIQATKECLDKGIKAAHVGASIGAIGEAIYKHAHSKGYSIIDRYGGHGISISLDGKAVPHASPFIANKAHKNDGCIIQSGMSIAIEPLLVIGYSNKTKLHNDGWTVICDNICAHMEKTLYIHQDQTEIITLIN